MQIESNLGFFKELACLSNISALWKLVDDVVFKRKHALDQSAEQLLLSASDIVVYGAGYFAQSVLSCWKGRELPIRYLIDGDPKKQGTDWHNYSVFSPKTLIEDQAKPLVVIAVMDSSFLINSLETIGVAYLFAERDGTVGYLPGHYLLRHREDCEKLYSLLADDLSRYVFLSVIIARIFQDFRFPMIGNIFTDRCSSHPQYFPRDLPPLKNGEQYLDCGVFDGDSLVCFALEAARLGIKGWKALGIEGDSNNVARARQNIANVGLSDVSIIESVLGSGQEKIDDLCLHNCLGSEIKSDISSAALDDLIADFEPTFLKMDIEGAEMQALIGGRRTILNFQPRLAICTYHSTAELIDIPLFINSNFPNYELYLRHHRAGSLWETVCYAI